MKGEEERGEAASRPRGREQAQAVRARPELPHRSQDLELWYSEILGLDLDIRMTILAPLSTIFALRRHQQDPRPAAAFAALSQALEKSRFLLATAMAEERGEVVVLPERTSRACTEMSPTSPIVLESARPPI